MAQSELQKHLSKLASEIKETAQALEQKFMQATDRKTETKAMISLVFKSHDLAHALRYHAGEQDEDGNAVEVE